LAIVAAEGVGLALRFSKRFSVKILAVVLGVIAASVPVLVFNVWLRNQGQDEAAVTAASALGYAEARLGQAVAAVKDLSANGVDACQPAQIEAMRRTVMLTGPVKEVMLIGPDGEITCTDSGVQTRQYIIDSAATPDRDIMLELIRMGDASERSLRVRKVGQADTLGIAAVVPAGLLLPQVSIQGGALRGAIRLTTPGGALIGEAGAEDAGLEQHHARLRSQPYGLSVGVSTPATGLIADQDGLRRIATLVTGMIAIAILLFALMRVRRQRGGTAADIARAILAEEFVPYYQPVVDIRTGKLLGAEVLVRWKRADGSFIEPAAFVALAGSSGPVLELTRSLMRRVRDDIGPAIGKRPHVTIAFRVAPQHFDDALIINDVGTIFDSSPVKLTQIVLELTGRHRIDNLIGMRRAIAALQGMGCKVAIDDVGTGHSGLSYILKLGVDIIKIDKAFVQSLDSEGHSRIIETLIDLAKNMRMEIVAEGVENFDQVMHLRKRGIAAAQGYVFAPPLPSGSFLQLLEAMDPAGNIATPAVAKADRTRSKVAPPTAGMRPLSQAAAAKAAPAGRVG
jgi:sensor c-di-GMP phosphodiesterase-like protein